MLGLFNSIMRSMGLVVVPGGLVEDGDWSKMTSENWSAVGDTDWENWDATADS